MGMVVRTNTMAVNANRQLSSNNTQVGKSLEKLSSGFRINRAGDDASGLAISEKMKAQIKGLEQASANSQDGISLIQTAEGNLTEVHDMLNRMVELAEKSANGILESTDRSAIQDEMDALAQEIDRIADSANFNNIKLFDGSLGSGGITATSTAGAAKGASTFVDKGTLPTGMSNIVVADGAFKTAADTAGDVSVTVTDVTAAAATITPGDAGKLTAAAAAAAKGSALNGLTITFAASGTAGFNYDSDAGTLTIDLGATTGTTTTDAELKTLITAAFAGTKGGEDVSQAIKDAIGGLTFSGSEITGGKTANDIKNLTIAFGDDGVDAGKKVSVTGAGVEAADKVEQTFTTAEWAAGGTFSSKGLSFDIAAGGITANGAFSTVTPGAPTAGKTELDFTGKTGKDLLGVTISYGGNTYEFVENADDVKGTNTAIVVTKASTDTAIAGLVQAALNGHPAQTDGANNDTVATANNADGDTTIVRISNNSTGADSAAPTATVGGGNGLKLQIGDTNDDYNKLQVSMDDMHMSALFDTTALTDADYTGTLGIGTAVLKDVGTSKSLDVSSQDNAGAALKSIRKVIDKVSTQRGQLGALQNRLEHTINNLDVTNENMTAANSRIRDTDMAKEMMNYTKMNVLVQSAQAMLAQANQQPQSILQLLQ